MKVLLFTFLAGLYFGSYGQTVGPSDTMRLASMELRCPPVHTWRSMMEAQLRRLQSGDSDEVGGTVYSIASAWAAAGFMGQTNELLTLFWDCKIRDPKYFEHINDGFCVMWKLSGKQPVKMPFETKPVDEIVQDNWDYLNVFIPGTIPVIPDSIVSKSWKDLTGRALSTKAELLGFDTRKTNHRADQDVQKEAILAFSKFFANDTPVAYEFSREASIAAIIATGLGEEESAKAFIIRLGQGYLQNPGSLMLANLMKDTATARLLLRGILAPIWGISDSLCRADLQSVKAILTKRARKGPTLVFGELTLFQLMRRISDSAICQKDIDFDTPVIKSRWLGYPPAKPELIRRTEQRLGIRLPEDYKSFLLVSNGFRATDNVGVTFLPVEKIGWLRDLDSEMAEILGTPMGTDDSARAAAFRRSILIGGLNEEQQFLLVPPGGTDKDWKYWFFGAWVPGEEAYPSLRFYLEHELQFMMDR